MITVTRKFSFDAAHRVVNHKSMCRMLHGHRYVVEATFGADQLDEIDMVIDFGEIKNRLGSWLNENWDHNTILNIVDKTLGDSIESLTGQKVFYMNCNPTAEKMAEFLKVELCPTLFKDMDVRCTEIKMYETPNCYAVA